MTPETSLPSKPGAVAADSAEQRLFAYLLDGKEAARRIGLQEASRWEPSAGPLWVHLDDSLPEARSWLKEERLGFQPLLEALGQKMPQLLVKVVDKEHLLIVLRRRAVDQPTPDVTRYMWIWLSPARAVTVLEGRSEIIQLLAQEIDSARGPKTIPDLLIHVLDLSVRRAELAVLQIDSDLTDLEYEETQGKPLATERPRAIRRRATEFRRFMTPYREILIQLRHIHLHWLRDNVAEQSHLLTEGATRVTEEIDTILERAQDVQDFLSDRRADELNRRIYFLTLLSAIMLPLTFLTGLLGVNLGGIPGADSPWAFPIFCVIIVAAGIFQFLAFRRLHWWR
jgi:zinc transporter